MRVCAYVCTGAGWNQPSSSVSLPSSGLGSAPAPAALLVAGWLSADPEQPASLLVPRQKGPLLSQQPIHPLPTQITQVQSAPT